MTSTSTPADRSRKAHSLVLKQLAERTQVQVAKDMGMSEATVSRITSGHLEQVLLFMAHLGLKVVPADFKCVDPAAYKFLTDTHQRVMSKAPELIWENDE